MMESLEPRQLLSAIGFGAVIHARRGSHVSGSTPGLQAPPSMQRDPNLGPAGVMAMPVFDPFGYDDLASSHVVLNNSGYNAVEAADSTPFSGSVGTVHLSAGFSLATTPQGALTRMSAGGTESMYIVIDWGDGSPQTLGTFQSISPAAYTIAGSHTWTAPGDYRLTAFIIVNGPGAPLPYVVHAAAGVAHVESTPESTQPPVVLQLPLYDPTNYVPPAFPQIKLPTSTPVDESGFSSVYDFVVA